MRLSLHIMYTSGPAVPNASSSISPQDSFHILVLGGMLVVGGTVLALQTDGLVCEEMAGDGVNSGNDSEAHDNNCS